MRKKYSRRSFLGLALGAAATLAACAVPDLGTVAAVEDKPDYLAPPLLPEDVDGTKLERTEAEWQALLSPAQYRVLRQKGTERAYTGKYNAFKETGTYHCAACGNPLFSSETKYESGTGWPSFWAPLSDDYIATERDTSLGMRRTEVLCARCDSHLGHVFEDGPEPTGLRYCMNSISLNFLPGEEGMDVMLEESGETAMATAEKLIYNFESTEEAGQWVKVNDGVMGGISQSELSLTPTGTAIFQGMLSLENYGGFASVRTYPQAYELGDFDGLELRVLGDGRRYKLRLRTDNGFDGMAYEMEFDTDPSDWVTVRLPFVEFEPTFRGRRLRNVPVLDGANVQQIGVMIADKREGAFRLELDWVKAYKNVA